MLSIFDELLPFTDEEQRNYWFKSTREDGLSVTLVASVYEAETIITVYSGPKIAAARVYFKNCSEVNVFDEKRKCFEILHDNGRGRCFVSLIGDTILAYEE